MHIYALMEKVRAIREGGHTQRAHTTPHYGSYSVAEHSWHVATLLAILHPNPSKDLILAGMWHDVHERWTGDFPSPIMKGIGHNLWLEVKKVTNIIERGLDLPLLVLTVEDRQWLKACDMLEFWLWCRDQLALGNMNALEGEKNVRVWIETHKDVVPNIVQDFVKNYTWHRTSDIDGWKIRKDQK